VPHGYERKKEIILRALRARPSSWAVAGG